MTDEQSKFHTHDKSVVQKNSQANLHHTSQKNKEHAHSTEAKNSGHAQNLVAALGKKDPAAQTKRVQASFMERHSSFLERVSSLEKTGAVESQKAVATLETKHKIFAKRRARFLVANQFQQKRMDKRHRLKVSLISVKFSCRM